MQSLILVVPFPLRLSQDFTYGQGRPLARRLDREPLPLTPKLISRFWSKVDRGGRSDCWLWQASLNRYGYGQFSMGYYPDGRQEIRIAHRVAYQIATGVHPPVGLVVRHQCDVPACCNPDHLLLGTQADNVIDAEVRGRYSIPRIPRAIRHDLIAQCLSGPRGTAARLAREHNVSFHALCTAVSRARRWRKQAAALPVRRAS